jgi:glycosyltransferase involved in cell wall biosynthesis
MRILIGSQTYPLPNGVTNSINESINGFLAAGHEVMLLAPDYGLERARPEHFVVPGSSFSRNAIKLIGILGKKELIFSLTAASEIERLAEKFHADAYWMHQVTYASNVFERFIFKSGLPTVLTYHTLLDYYGKVYGGIVGEQAMIFRSAKVANLASQVIAPSQYVKSKLIGWGVKKPIEVISTGIKPIESSFSSSELHQRFKIPNNHKVLLFVGRVVREKNIAALLKMLKDLLKTDPNVTLLMIGPGDIEATTEEAKELGIDKNVVMTGQVSAADARKCYGGADVFVFASQSETQGLVIGEAMLAETPVVALTAPIQEEIYPDDVAVVVREESQFAVSVKKVLDDDTGRKQLTTAAKKFVEDKFSTSGMISKQVALFERLIDR